MNPDCAQGKHAACSGDAWNEIADELTTCDCDCHQDRPDLPQNHPENATGGEKATRVGLDGEGGLKSAHSASVGGRLDEIRAREQAATDRPDPCVMTHTPPFDFAQCETHDETFPLGDSCKWHGVESISVFLQDQVDQQRGRAVRAEMQRDRLQAQVNAVMVLHRKITRYGNEDTSIDAEQYLEAPEDAPDSFRPFDLCAECYEVERDLFEDGAAEWIGVRSAWPCPTVRAITEAVGS